MNIIISPRLILMSLLLMCLIPCSLIGEDQAPLPSTAQKALERLDMDIADARAECDAEIIKATAKAAKVIEREVKSATKKGDLAVATALQTKLDELNAQLMAGGPESSEYPEAIKISTTTGIVPAAGGSIFANRGFQLINVPEQLSSWHVVQQMGGAPIQQRLRASGPLTFYLLSMDQGLRASGMKKTDLTCNYSDGGQTILYLYEVSYRGGDFLAPSTSAFSGVMILIPHGEVE